MARVSVDVVIEGTVRIRAVATAEELVLEGRGLNHRIPWDSITAAGLARVRASTLAAGDPGASQSLPGMGRLSAAALGLAHRNRLLLIGRSRGRGRPRAVTFPLPAEDPSARLLLEELKRRLGSRWLGEDRDQRELKRELGAAYPLWYWPAGVAFVLAVVAVTLPAMGAWALLAGADPQGRNELTDARWWMFAGLAAWLGLCALLFLAARRAVGGDQSWRFAAPIPLVLLLAVLTPPAVATIALLYDWRFSDLEPAPLVALAAWLGLIAVATRVVRRLLD